MEKFAALQFSYEKMINPFIKIGAIDTEIDQLFLQKIRYVEKDSSIIIINIGRLSKTSDLHSFDPEQYVTKRLQIARNWIEENLLSR